MIRWSKRKKISNNAKIVMGDKKRINFTQTKLEKFYQELEKISEGHKKYEAFITKKCLEIGEKIILLPDGEIQLFFTTEDVLRKESDSITENQELYSLLENLVQS